MTRNRTQTISVEGDLYEMNMVQITEDQFKELTEGAGRESNFWNTLEEELLGDSLINGFTYSEDGPNFRVYVDDQEYPGVIDIPVSDSVQGQDSPPRSQAKPSDKTYHLVVEKFAMKAQLQLDIKEEFDPARLEVVVDNQEFPDGSIQSVLSLFYGAQDFDFSFEKSWTGCDEIYIITSDGEKCFI